MRVLERRHAIVFVPGNSLPAEVGGIIDEVVERVLRESTRALTLTFPNSVIDAFGTVVPPPEQPPHAGRTRWTRPCRARRPERA